MTSPSPKRTKPKVLAIGTIVLFALIAGSVVAILDLSGPSAVADGASDWKPSETSPTLTTVFDEKTGPVVLASDGTEVATLGARWIGRYGHQQGLAGCNRDGSCLETENENLTWSHEQSDANHLYVGTHQGRFAKVTATWTFTDGSPLALLRVTLERTADAYPDREALVFSTQRSTTILGQDLEHFTIKPGRSEVIGPNTPHQVTLGLGSAMPAALTVWGFPGLGATATESSTQIALEINDAAHHPFRPAADCGLDEGPERRAPLDRIKSVSGTSQVQHGIMRFGEGWSPVPWRNPEGRGAAIAIVDAAPGTSARRLRALLWGHSDPQDPRYGNGGFLGHRLAITKGIHTGPRGMGSGRFAETVRQAAGTGVRFANQSATPEEDTPSLNEAGMDVLAEVGARVWIDNSDGCEDFFGNGWRSGGIAGPLKDHGYTWIWGATSSPWSQETGLNQLQRVADGRRPVLWHHDAAGARFGFFSTVDLVAGRSRIIRALSEKQLSDLADERGVSIVRTAFDRTHIAGVLAETGMIIREDDGHYVLDGELEKILFDLEDMGDRGLLWTTTVEELGDRFTANSKVRSRPASDGSVLVTNSGETAIRSWSISTPSGTLTVNGQPPAGTRTFEGSTVAWFDLPAGESVTLDIRDPEGELTPAAQPIRWTFSDAGETRP